MCGPRIVAIALTLGLSACASMRPRELGQQGAEAAWSMQRAALSNITHFTLHGRIAGGPDGISGNLVWQQHDDGRFELHLSGPFGVGAVAITGTPRLITVQSAKGSYTSTDPQNWIREQTGWTLPLTRLRWWVLGLPAPDAPAQIALDGAGHIKTLTQDGWQLEYSEYQEHDGRLLPRRFVAALIAADKPALKVVADRWSDLPPLE